LRSLASKGPVDEAELDPSFVRIDHVDLRYGGDAPAVVDLQMAVGKGQFAAVVGPSGCGKSSLMKLVNGLLPPTAGSITVAGKRVNGPLKIVGMAFQNSILLPWRNIIDNVMLPLEIVEPYRSQMRTKRGEFEVLARDLLRSVGLQGFEQSHPWMLSGGMQQRANLCRALIHSPDLLMLDEPFAALDAFTREELWGILQELWMRRRFTTILVTHDLREAAFLADVIHVMSGRPGHVIASHRVDLPRPRTIETTFDPTFNEAVHEIRREIADERQRTGIGIAVPAQASL
jgi:NitT/TauT family transport system ATP-binding protein